MELDGASKEVLFGSDLMVFVFGVFFGGEKREFGYLNFSSIFCSAIFGLPLTRFDSSFNKYFITFRKNFSQISAALFLTTKLCHSVEVIFSFVVLLI
jgi:hypothetical protein